MSTEAPIQPPEAPQQPAQQPGQPAQQPLPQGQWQWMPQAQGQPPVQPPSSQPPPSQPPEKKRHIKWWQWGLIGLGGLLVLIIIATAASGGGGSTSTSTPTTQNPTTAPATQPPTVAPPTTPPTTAPTQPPQRAKTVLKVSGNGDKTTDTFTVSGKWQITYTVEPSDVVVFGFFVYPEGESQIYADSVSVDKAGTDTTVEHTGGTYYIKVISAGPWNITVTDLPD